MRKIREILRLKYEQGLSHREIAQACAIGAGTVSRYLRKTTARGVGWPLPAELDDAALEADLFPRPAPVRNRGPAGLRVYPPRAQAERCHAVTALGGVRRRPSERLPLHPVLRGLPAVGGAAAALDAAGAPRRRKDLHRLLGQAAEPGRPPHGCAPARRAVPRRARRQQPHLRRSDRDAAVAGLVRRAHPHGGVLRRLHHDVGPRPVAQRGHPPLPLRARRQSRLRGPGRPLRRRCRPGATAQAAGQGSGFILRTFLYMRCKFRISPPVSEPFSGMGDGQRSGGRLEEYRPFVVGTHGVQHAFLRESLGRAQMHVELRGHLRDGQPTCRGQVLQVAVDVVRPTQGADACGGKGQTASGPQPPPVERLGNLSIGLFGGEHADLFDKRGRSTTQVRRRERQWTLDLTRRARRASGWRSGLRRRGSG